MTRPLTAETDFTLSKQIEKILVVPKRHRGCLHRTCIRKPMSPKGWRHRLCCGSHSKAAEITFGCYDTMKNIRMSFTNATIRSVCMVYIGLSIEHGNRRMHAARQKSEFQEDFDSQSQFGFVDMDINRLNIQTIYH